MSKELQRAVEAMASAVHMVALVGEKPSPDPEERNHVKEYLPDMEEMLIDQLLTSVQGSAARQKILSRYELDFLQEELEYAADERLWIETELDGL